MRSLRKVVLQAGLIISALTAVSGAALPTAIKQRQSSGFVTASGTGFVLDGKTFSFGGTNAYWATSLASEDITSLFSQMNSAGLKVLRIFGWGDNVGPPNDGSFQSWSGSTNTPNPAAFEAHMDPLISAAEAAGIKLVVPMIGNWGPSINLYIQQILGSDATHDTFFSNAELVAAYKTYVNFFVNRYKDSPAIFAWELMNEPRCTGDDGRGASSSCGPPVITNWIEDLSSYIKALDASHMVTVGDEGWFTSAQGYGDSGPYDGSNGIDWVTNLGIDSVDYGTVHLYPSSWGEPDSWGNTWIDQHATQAQKAGKPVVLEEFGTTDVASRQSIVNGWLGSAYSGGFAGFQYWQFVSSFPSGYESPDDGNGISTTEPTYGTIKAFAAKFGGGTNSSSSASAVGYTTASSSNVAPSLACPFPLNSTAASPSKFSASAGYSQASSVSTLNSYSSAVSSVLTSSATLSQSATSVLAASASASTISGGGSDTPDAQGYILPSNGTASTTQFVLGTELSGGTACGMDSLPSGTCGSSPGTGPGYLYAAVNQLAFGANPLGRTSKTESRRQCIS